MVRWTWKIDVVLIAEGVPEVSGQTPTGIEAGEPSDSEGPISSRVGSVYVAGGFDIGPCAGLRDGTGRLHWGSFALQLPRERN